MVRVKPQIDPEKSYSVKEIAALLEICRDTIYRYTREETIVPVRITAREIYYPGSEVSVLFDAMEARRHKKKTP